MIDTLNKCLLEGGEILDKIGLPYMLIGGTLLGIFRDGHLLEHDYDVDVAVLDEDLTEEVMKKIKAHKSNKQYGHKQIVFTCNGRSFDIFPVHKKGNERYFNATDECLVWPAELFENGWGAVDYLGKEWNTPYNPIKYFDIMYGDWRTVDKKFKWQTSPCMKLVSDI